MLYLLQALSAWMTAALVIGFVVGLIPVRDRRPASLTGWPLLALFCFALAALVALLGLLPGRAGFGLETALLLAAAYASGGLCGTALRRLFGGTRVTPPKAAAPDDSLKEMEASVKNLAAWAEALAAATPAALKETQAAQEFLARQYAAPAAAPPSTPPAVVSSPPVVPAQEPAPCPPPREPVEGENDLRLIRGVDDGVAHDLHALGVTRFAQLAALTPELDRQIAEALRGCGPALRKFWVAQAQLLAGGVETEYARAARLGEAPNAGKPIDEAAAKSLRAALPQVIAPQFKDEIYAGQRPLSLLQPPQGEKHALNRIAGIDSETAERLNALGIWTFGQIASWSTDNIRWIGFYLASPGRVERENWVEQARALVAGERQSA